MFSFLKNKLQKIYGSVTSRVAILFGYKTIDEAVLRELEAILLSADTGVKTTKKIMGDLRHQWESGTIKAGADLKKALEHALIALLPESDVADQSIVMVVGVNGSGKTTFVGKLANYYKQQGKRVLLVGADTFRAAAMEQLDRWAKQLGIEIIVGKQGQDPAAVVFQGCEEYKRGNFDVLIIDTAGRLQTKIGLMKELEKIKKTVARHFPDQSINTLLTVDAMLGQNSFEQARLFHESTDLKGIVLTKMDGTGKGGIVFAIVQELGIPIVYISYGEQPENMKKFDKQEYIADLLSL